MRGVRTPVDRTEAEVRESELNRVAWNLPRKVTAAPSKPLRETPTGDREVLDSDDEQAEDG